MSKEDLIVAVSKPPEEREREKREKSEPPRAPEPGAGVNDVLKLESKIDPPLSAFEKINGKPYSVDFFKVQEWDYPELDIDKKIDKVKFIESWIKDKIKEDRLEDSIESYKEIMQGYFTDLNIGKTEKNESKLDRVYSYLKIVKKQKSLDERKREIINGLKR